MKTKDCFFGQIRAVTETRKGKHNTWTPEALNVKKQWGVTWDNATGMNPLWSRAPIPVAHHSYGDVIAKAAHGANSFVNDFIKPNQTPEYYEQRIKEDYNSHEARLAFLFAIPWGIHAITSQPDNSEYDFVTARQFDTWWKADKSAYNDIVNHIFTDYAQQISENTPNIQNIPLAYGLGVDIAHDPIEFHEFPVIGSSKAVCHVFNKQAIKLINGQFFDMALREFETIYKQLNTDLQSQIMNWQPGYIVHRVLTKLNIHTIDMRQYNIIDVKEGWNGKPSLDFAHNERSTGKSD